jgi:pyruvate/2-oxoglutarate dehydrogenase complex dihydrolipoamide acyltransferase (E2) component
MTEKDYRMIPFPKVRQPIVDALRQAKRMNVMQALLEVDVTDARRIVKEFRVKTGKPLSFTTFLTFCLAHAVAENKSVQAYRKGGKLIIFDDVDIAVTIEREFEGDKIPISPLVVKAANRKTHSEIHNEISNAKAENINKPPNNRLINLYWYAPGFIRSLLWHIWLGSPYWRKRLTGTVGFSALGMFGKGTGWGIPVSTYSLSITMGTIGQKPALIDGKLETREFLDLTASFDHDVIDGAPAARFITQFKELIESSYGLRETV